MQKAYIGPGQIKGFRNNYLALAIATALFMITSVCHAQSVAPYDSTKKRQLQASFGFDWGNGSFGTLRIPRDTVRMALKDSGAIAYKGGSMWMYNGRYWRPSSSGVVSSPGNGIDSLSYNNTTLFVWKDGASTAIPFTRFICYTRDNYNNTQKIGYNCNDEAVDSSSSHTRFVRVKNGLTLEESGPYGDTLTWGGRDAPTLQAVIDTGNFLDKSTAIEADGNDFSINNVSNFGVNSSNGSTLGMYSLNSGTNKSGSLLISPASSNLQNTPTGLSGSAIGTTGDGSPYFTPTAGAFAYDYNTNDYHEFRVYPTYMNIFQSRGTGFINHGKLRIQDADTVNTSTNVAVFHNDTLKKMSISDLSALVGGGGSSDGNGIYDGSGTLSSDVTVSMNSHSMNFSGGNDFNIADQIITDANSSTIQSPDGNTVGLFNNGGFGGIQTSGEFDITAPNLVINGYTMPVSPGTSGQIMQIDGSNVVTWVNPPSSVSGTLNDSRLAFSANGSVKDTSTLSYDRANARVGIGTATPADILDIRKDQATTNTATTTSLLLTNANSTGAAAFAFTDGTGTRTGGIQYNNTTGLKNIFSASYTDIPYYFGVNNGIKMSISSSATNYNVGIGITTAAASAKLQVVSTTQGFLPPVMTTTQVNAIAAPAEGLKAYDLTLHKEKIYDGTVWGINARTDIAQTFTGTQTFGAIVGTSFNGNTWSAGTGTLSIAAGKTLTASNSLTLAGTDATVMTFPSTSQTIPGVGITNTWSATQIFNGLISLGASSAFYAGSATSTTAFAYNPNAANTLTSGTTKFFSLVPSYNQASGTAANYDAVFNRAQTAVGSGIQRLLSLQVNSVEQAGFDNVGKLNIVSGSNKSVGTATLVSGTVTISNTSVTASSLIFFSYKTPLGILGSGLQQGTIVAGTSFVINSLTSAGAVNTTDNSVVNYWIIN